MNSEKVWQSLDVPKEVANFSIESDEIANAFLGGNDMYVNTMPQVKYVLENGVDVLIYNGNLDLACNTAGNFRWTNALSWNGQAAFNAHELTPWFSKVGGVQVQAGKFKDVRAFGKKGDAKKQRFAFVTIDNSGHMVSLLS